MNKSDVFLKEIEYIENEKYKLNISLMLNILPDYFFRVPASSTGKYHPAFSLGEKGLVRHTKAAVRIAKDLMDNSSIGYKFNQNEKDLILMALLLHDGLKLGLNEERYTKSNHPILVCEYLISNKSKFSLNDEELLFITSLIETHMGEWNKDLNGNEILKKPSNKYQEFVHLCDYLSSRRYLDIKFIDNNIIN
ncbi:MAG: hypothetical protein RSB41_00575 [Bacilli bacterium]